MGAPAIAPGRPVGQRSHAVRVDAKVDPMKALELKLKGLSDSEIAACFAVSERRIGQVLAKMKPLIRLHREGMRLFSEDPHTEDELLDSARALILQNMTNPAVISAANLRDSALSYDKLHLHTRLRKGESTSNNAIAVVLSGSMSTLRSKLKAERASIDEDRSIRSDAAIDATPSLALPAPTDPTPAVKQNRPGGGGNEAPPGASAPSRSAPLAGGEPDRTPESIPSAESDLEPTASETHPDSTRRSAQSKLDLHGPTSFAASYALAIAPVLTAKPRGRPRKVVVPSPPPPPIRVRADGQLKQPKLETTKMKNRILRSLRAKERRRAKSRSKRRR